MATAQSAPNWWQEAVRVELAEIMDDLEPGWSEWRAGPAPSGRGQSDLSATR
ncbi:MAG: hypothetical protein M3217_09970 [Actinomycetota bacterium]|nr:hypothetical protein [Actinomycetota bacterium]